jgi:sulfoxide reductase heme-binding subunit YedZ
VNPKLWWYVARASGLVTWTLVTCAVIWGLALSGRVTKRPRPAWVLDLHRFLGALSVAFLGVHVAALVADNYTHFGPAELMLPLASKWRPAAVAWGIVGLYLLIAIEVTSLMKRRLTERLWRSVHLTSLGLFVVVTVHAFMAGADARNPLVQWFALVSSSVVAFLLLFRVLTLRARADSRASRLERLPRQSDRPAA